MLHSKTLNHQLRPLRKVKLWHLAVLLLLFAGLSALLLRQNNLGMVERREQVKIADRQNGDVHGALRELQRYVGGHMNTGMGERGIYLEATYQRAYDRAVQQAIQQNSINSNLYQQADTACRAVYDGPGGFSAYVQCVTDRVGSLAPAQDPLSALKEPPVDLFRYNFVSPRWSPDLAGWSVVVTLGLAAVITGRLAVRLAASAIRRLRRARLP